MNPKDLCIKCHMESGTKRSQVYISDVTGFDETKTRIRKTIVYIRWYNKLVHKKSTPE